MRNWGVCKDCALKENCAEYKPNKLQCEDYERYQEVLTNEEWIKQCNTEEMEHTLTMLIMKDRFFADKEFAYVNIRFGVHCWLKEIHK